MLTESFIASTLNPFKQSQSSLSKDLGIYIHEFQPTPSLKSSLKKSSTHANCLAVGASHIFAAQSEKAVVHVYNRESGNQEIIVPFPEKIRSLALAGGAEQDVGILLLGTEAGGLILWELATGRTVTTPPAHLQATTHLTISSDVNYFLSGSPDSTLLLWSLPSILSFEDPAIYSSTSSQFSPIKTLSSHRAAITALLFGHSHGKTNIAISASKDNTVMVWDPLQGEVLHTILLSSPAMCLALDPADRACYAGYEDGSIQFIDFYNRTGVTQMLQDPDEQSTPTQAAHEERWKPPSDGEGQGIISLQTSYDGTVLLSGHQNGKIQSWDVGQARYRNTLEEYEHPVTNLLTLPLTGFPSPKKQLVKLRQVVKPRYDSSFAGPTGANGEGVPVNYTFTAQFVSNLPLCLRHEQVERKFQDALCHPSFPAEWLEEGIAAFASGSAAHTIQRSEQIEGNDDTESDQSKIALKKLQNENDILKAQLSEAMARHRATISENMILEKQRWRQKEEERFKSEKKKRRRLRRMAAAEVARKKVMGEAVADGSDGEMDVDGTEVEEEDGLSSSTDEITDSD